MSNVLLEKVRIAYPNIFTPTTDNSGNEKYTAVILIPKDQEDNIKKVQAGIKEAKSDSFGNKTIKNLFNPLKDGDAEDCTLDFAAGHYYMNVHTKFKCGVVDRKCQRVIDPDALQSGDWVCASISFGGFDVQAKKGITCYLQGLQIVASGEPLGTSGASPENIFKKWDEEEDSESDVMQNPDTQKQEEDDLDDVLGF